MRKIVNLNLLKLFDACHVNGIGCQRGRHDNQFHQRQFESGVVCIFETYNGQQYIFVIGVIDLSQGKRTKLSRP